MSGTQARKGNRTDATKRREDMKIKGTTWGVNNEILASGGSRRAMDVGGG